MRHRVKKARLGRSTAQRKALIRSLITALLTHGSIQTTETRGKVLRSEFDELVSTVGRKKEGFSKIRSAKETIFTETAQKILIEKVVPALQKKSSGFTRLTHLGPRKGDATEMVQVDLFVS